MTDGEWARPRYYDRNGQPIDLYTWSVRFHDKDYQRVAKDEGDGWKVSTVWLGLDHQFGDGPPLIFETMVFGGPLDDETVRYSTLAEAEAGHAAVLERVRHASSSSVATLRRWKHAE
jgi:hypothetical protein